MSIVKEMMAFLRDRASGFRIQGVAGYLLLVSTLLIAPQVGWSTDEVKREITSSTPLVSSPAAQPVTEAESREDKKGDVTVSVQSLEDVMRVMTSSVPDRLEANVQSLTAAQAEKHGLRPNQGVVIIWLDPKGPLGRNGLSISDVILQVENQPVESLSSFVTMVNSLGTLRPATFSVLDHRTGRVRDVKILIKTEHRVQEARGNFVGRNVGAAVAGIQKTAQSLHQQIGYVVDAGKEAVTDIIRGLKRWVSASEKPPIASIKKSEDVPAKPSRNGGPG